ncbi:MAG: phosphatidylglycerol lysyltransferase domain-containing protein [Desulfobacterales bacterium]|jgi:hypothetical protein
MSLNFEPITLDKQKEYSKHFALCSQKASDYSFVNLWGWAEEYGLSWAWSDNLVWIKQTVPEKMHWAPVGAWESVDWNKCFSEYFSSETLFDRMPESLLRLWEDSFNHLISFEESRGHWDYIYSVIELIDLKGKRFHKKKNLLNQFRKKYDFEYVPFGTDMIHKAMMMQEDWCTWRDCESSDLLSAENRTISKILTQWETIQGLTGGAIIANQKMAGYTIAERLTDDTLLIHFEKGNPDYKGIYQAINQMFLERSGNTFEFVNREQDLDIQGLRKAKLSYHPVNFIKKYKITYNIQ